METRVESNEADQSGGAPSLRVRLLGPLTISRDGVTLPQVTSTRPAAPSHHAPAQETVTTKKSLSR